MLDRLLHDRETRSDMRMVRFGLLMLALLIFAVVKSCGEIRLTLSGVEAPAEIVRIEGSRQRNSTFATILFDDEDGRATRIRRTVPDRLLPDGGTGPTTVVYVSGDPEHAKLASERSWFWPIVLAVVIVGTVVGSMLTYRWMERS